MEAQQKIFISYSSKDQVQANALCSFLEGSGLNCWIAPRDIVPGNIYGEKIVEAINNCDAVLLFFTENSNRSAHVANEIDIAFNANKRIIVYKLGNFSESPALMYYLRRTQWIVARNAISDNTLILKTCQNNPCNTPKTLDFSNICNKIATQISQFAKQKNHESETSFTRSFYSFNKKLISFEKNDWVSVVFVIVFIVLLIRIFVPVIVFDHSSIRTWPKLVSFFYHTRNLLTFKAIGILATIVTGILIPPLLILIRKLLKNKFSLVLLGVLMIISLLFAEITPVFLFRNYHLSLGFNDFRYFSLATEMLFLTPLILVIGCGPFVLHYLYRQIEESNLAFDRKMEYLKTVIHNVTHCENDPERIISELIQEKVNTSGNENEIIRFSVAKIKKQFEEIK
ncbi:MAG TPA: toll/interleukin-1 receptor domain-containing protein [Bacteroidales bacterium]|nr:toll/interleukin-1 receptor domain-containing protein [Bacteroidales bacterium]